MKPCLIVLSTIVLVAAGCGGPTAAERREIAEWVIEQGGTVVTDNVLEVDTISALPTGSFQLERIELADTSITDDDLQRLAPLRNLRYLGLYGTAVGDKGMESVAQIKSLEELELSYTQVTNLGLHTLSQLGNLEKVFVTGTDVTQQAVEEFRTDCGCEVVRLQ